VFLSRRPCALTPGNELPQVAAVVAYGRSAGISVFAKGSGVGLQCRRLPFFRWMLRMLQASGDQSLKWDVFMAALEREFPPDEAEHQLDTALDWGRYAELFSYDDAEGRFYLEPVEQPAAAPPASSGR
jgi:NitT/TauT family transport system ATP-binding protein